MPVPFPLTTNSESFISAWFLSDTKICDELINYFKNSTDKIIGEVQKIDGKVIDPQVKDSEEITLYVQDQKDIFLKYLLTLQEVVDEYKKKFPQVDAQGAWSITEGTNLQYYKPGGGYKVWHCERSSYKYPNSSRHLVFMTYLNDVDDEGETEFLYQQLKVKPVKGLTLIWPADWTHTHRGIVSPSQEKYIITGWFNFIQ